MPTAKEFIVIAGTVIVVLALLKHVAPRIPVVGDLVQTAVG